MNEVHSYRYSRLGTTDLVANGQTLKPGNDVRKHKTTHSIVENYAENSRSVCKSDTTTGNVNKKCCLYATIRCLATVTGQQLRIVIGKRCQLI